MEERFNNKLCGGRDRVLMELISFCMRFKMISLFLCNLSLAVELSWFLSFGGDGGGGGGGGRERRREKSGEELPNYSKFQLYWLS